METRTAMQQPATESSGAHEVHQHTRQGLAGVRDQVGATEESWPYVVSAVAGVAGIVLASMVGAAELAVGVAAAYVAYDVIARGVPLWDAIRQAEKEIKE